MLTVKAYAKINLALDILGKRQDGYHEVAMIMQSVSLCDTIELSEQDGDVTVTANIPALACDNTNLAYKAAALLRNEFAVKNGVNIHLNKQIPMAAGLAGGSADAAAVLTGLNSLWQLGLSSAELAHFGARLGSDVPFCIMGGTALATGRGEVLERLPAMPECYVVLVKPPVDISTAWAYGNFLPERVVRRPNLKAMQHCLKEGDLSGVAARLCNVFETVAIPEYPIIGIIKETMLRCGLMASLMSGSGPTVFGLTDNALKAEAVADVLKEVQGAAVFVAKTVLKAGDNVGTEIIAD